MRLSYFEGRRSGEVVSRIADVNAINNLVSQIVLGLPSQFVIALVSWVSCSFIPGNSRE
nr:hypothetical protein [Scytonema hofmannii]